MSAQLAQCCVVPLVGTWIEIDNTPESKQHKMVVPLVGTWIEISEQLHEAIKNYVVPLVGTWIEISNAVVYLPCEPSRSPRGNVD